MNARRTSGAPALAVGLNEFKAHARIDGSDEDALATAYLRAAQEFAETHCNIALTEQTWEVRLDAPVCLPITLPRWPVISVDAVAYVDGNSPVPELDADQYRLVPGRPARLYATYAASWPSIRSDVDAFRVSFTAGCGDTDGDVVEPMRQAILLLAGHWFTNRETSIVGVSIAEVPFATQALLNQQRVLL